MAYPCPQCDGTQTAAAYYHKCANKNWFTVVCPAPDPDPTTGRPAPVQCPDGLVNRTSPTPITYRSSVLTGCTSPGPIEARTLYCYTCRTMTVFPPTQDE